jgi:hypothetical protein
MIADLPQRGTMFPLVPIAGKLLEVTDEVRKGRVAFTRHQQVDVIRHETVCVKGEGVAVAGA